MVPLHPRLERRFEAASVSSLHDELMCHLPLGFLAIKIRTELVFRRIFVGDIRLSEIAVSGATPTRIESRLPEPKRPRGKKNGPPAANRGRRGDGGEHNSSPSGLEHPRRRSFLSRKKCTS